MNRSDVLARAAAVKDQQITRLRRRKPLLSKSFSLFPKQDEAISLARKLGESEEDEAKHLEAFDIALRPCQERPQSLDVILGRLSRSLIIRVESPSVSRALYLLCKIRGRKAVAKLLPSEVAQFP